MIEDDFCAAFPGSSISIKSYDWTGKYDHTWSYTSGWEANKCSSCDIDLSYTCPYKPAPKPTYTPSSRPTYTPSSHPSYTPSSRPSYTPSYTPSWYRPTPSTPTAGPTCDVCFEWTLSGCESNYYGDNDACNSAMQKVYDLFGECGYEGECATGEPGSRAGVPCFTPSTPGTLQHLRAMYPWGHATADRNGRLHTVECFWCSTRYAGVLTNPPNHSLLPLPIP